MKSITQRTIINNQNLGQIRFHLRNILDIRSGAVRAMLPIVAGREIFPFQL